VSLKYPFLTASRIAHAGHANPHDVFSTMIGGPAMRKVLRIVLFAAISTAPLSSLFAQSGQGNLTSGGKCLDVHLPDEFKNGARVQVRDCSSRDNQTWRFAQQFGGGRTAGELVTVSGKCLDVHLPDLGKNGAKVQVWDCWGGNNQKWHLRGTQLVSNEGIGNKCLDVHLPDFGKNGATVQLWDCHGGINQDWQSPVQPIGAYCGGSFGELRCPSGAACQPDCGAQTCSGSKFCR
jgi:hypothetical protein